MQIGSVFENNRTQAVRLPLEVRFEENIKKVLVRKLGKERVLTPIDNIWDSFFLGEESVTDDFMQERAPQEQQAREDF